MKNDQQIGDISNSCVVNVNTNNQTKNDYYDLKRLSCRIKTEVRPKANTAERIGSLFYEIVCQMEKLENKRSYRIYFVCFLSLILSIIAIISAIFRAEFISVEGANLIGWIIGIIAVLVTVLIGFQIYKSIEIKDIINETINSTKEKIMKEIESELKNHINEFHK